MHAAPKAVCGYLAGWLLIILFVVLLTFIFSFVGTIICAALAGMMMGAARLPGWQSLALSIVFPAVIATVLRATKAELPASQVLFLALLCLAVFWSIYFVVYALVAQEQKQQAVETQRPPVRRPHSSPLAAVSSSTAPGQAGGQLSPACCVVTLEALQGNWVAQSTGPDYSQTKKTIEIKSETLVLSLSDGEGHVRSVAKAHLTLCGGSVLALSAEAAVPNEGAQTSV